MTLKKFVPSFIFFYFAYSFPLSSQKFRTVDLEFSTGAHTFLQNKPIHNTASTNPVSFQVIYWKDFGGSFDISSDGALRNQDYKTIVNKAYNSPQVGIYVNAFSNLSASLGTIYTLGATTDIGIWQKGSSYMSIRPKIGLSNFIANYNSLLVINSKMLWSQINANLGLGLFFVTQRPIQSVKIGIEYNHFSNGAIKHPNVGINLIGLSLSYVYGNYLFPWLVGERKEIQEAFKRTDLRLKFKYQLSSFLKQLNPNQAYYSGFNTSIGVYKPINIWLDINSKLSLNNDQSRKIESIKSNNSINNNYRMGISAGLVLHFHRLDLHANTGVYLYKPERILDKLFYQEYQLDYKLNYKFYTFMGVFSHLKTTDYTHFGIGYNL